MTAGGGAEGCKPSEGSLSHGRGARAPEGQSPHMGPVVLIEVALGDPQERAVALGSQREDEGLPREHRQLPHQLAGLGHEQAHVLGLVDHALVDVQAAPEHKVQAHILGQAPGDGHRASTCTPTQSIHSKGSSGGSEGFA